jgi:hypothetical protein
MTPISAPRQLGSHIPDDQDHYDAANDPPDALITNVHECPPFFAFSATIAPWKDRRTSLMR